MAKATVRRTPSTRSGRPSQEDAALLKQKSYVLTTGDPKKPEMNNPVDPGFPFQPAFEPHTRWVRVFCLETPERH